jgi:hypothetical protein
MDRERLIRMIRWACVPVVPLFGLLVTIGASTLLTVLLGVPSGPLSVVSLLLCILAPLLFVVPAVLMAPSYRVAVAAGLGAITRAVHHSLLLKHLDHIADRHFKTNEIAGPSGIAMTSDGGSGYVANRNS